jgi:anaerobic selenocysteine-containing dehydrogenase
MAEVTTICSVSGHVGLGYTMGIATGMDPEDVVNAGTIVIWGSNTLIANQHFWPFVEEAKANGATVVVIDPVKTRTAVRADLHLAPRVGTDAALALGLCRAIVAADGHDTTFVADNTVGFDEFRSSIEPWTIEQTAAECGLEAAEIEQLVRVIVDGGPLAIKVGQGIQRSAYGGQTTRVVSCLAAVTGAFSQVGGGLVYSTGAAYDFNRDAAAGTQLGNRPRDLVMTTLAADLDRADDPPVEALFVYAANPVVSNPDVNAVRKSLSRPDLFTVAVDIYHTETTDYADIVLPSTMQHEQLEVNDSFSHLYVNLNMPAVAPSGECLPHTEIFRRLARAMDLHEPALYASDKELAAAVLDTPAFHAAGINVESLQETGWARLPGAQSPYRPFAEGFPTPSGRFEFTSERGEAEGHGRLPNYRRAAESGRPSQAGAGAVDWYDLVAAAGDWHINSVFAGTKKTQARTGQPRLAIHPDDAARDGLTTGDEITVSNDRGSFDASVVVNESVRPGLAATTKGWWGMGINNTVAERDSDMGRGAVYHDNRVRINRRR